jgi:phage anti-repressor protein
MFGSDAALKLAVTKEISMANPQLMGGNSRRERRENKRGNRWPPRNADGPEMLDQ